jgi:hypothetical protein
VEVISTDPGAGGLVSPPALENFLGREREPPVVALSRGDRGLAEPSGEGGPQLAMLGGPRSAGALRELSGVLGVRGARSAGRRAGSVRTTRRGESTPGERRLVSPPISQGARKAGVRPGRRGSRRLRGARGHDGWGPAEPSGEDGPRSALPSLAAEFASIRRRPLRRGAALGVGGVQSARQATRGINCIQAGGRRFKGLVSPPWRWEFCREA